MRYLFNSYYNAAGDMHRRDLRGLISRPTVAETYRFRHSIDARIQELLEGADDELLEEMEPVFTIGLHHEQQHQELLVTDIKTCLLAITHSIRSSDHGTSGRSGARSPPRAMSISRRRSLRSGMTATVSATITKGRDIARWSRHFPRDASGHERRISRLHRGGRLRTTGILALVRLDDGQRTRLGRVAGAALLG